MLTLYGERYEVTRTEDWAFRAQRPTFLGSFNSGTKQTEIDKPCQEASNLLLDAQVLYYKNNLKVSLCR